MLEIIALFFLTRKIGALALKKGQKAGTWKLYTILSWLAGETLGIIAGLMIFDYSNIVSIMLMAIAGAIGGYIYIQSKLEQMPDNIDDDIRRIGVDDLRP